MKKNTRRFFVLFLAIVMTTTLCLPAYAAESADDDGYCNCADPSPETYLGPDTPYINTTGPRAHVWAYPSVYSCCVCEGIVIITEYEAEVHTGYVIDIYNGDGYMEYFYICEVCGEEFSEIKYD